jgi:hypothetical protein
VDCGLRIFLAGIMQGSHRTACVHDQQYRRRLVEQLRRYLPGCEIYDPWADHQNSLEYSDEQGRRVFFHHNRLSAQVDLLIAYVPEASMGTAIEMWEAHRHGRVVVTISPLAHNWTVKFLSDLVYPDWEPFFADLSSGTFSRWFQSVRQRKAESAYQERHTVPGV